ncbi:tripartite motif-containing protein 45-like [Actinia tenebrosa]|uniref:Tripartite motif-containing protein 45-like n=1 Tax=Actinia tenebrosa TaxID=6105 RepID=A0A6P8IDV1_ACTTE|nr:tripartite motif-containing protein 45-like [Actinia tenebrosa]
MKTRIKQKGTAAERNVDVFIDTQIRILQQIRTELKQGVGTVCKAKLRSIRLQEDHLSQHLANIKNGVHFARQAIRNGSESEILSLKSQIITRLADLSEKLIYPSPSQDDGIVLRIDSETTLRDLMPKLVRIDSSTAVPSSCSLQVIGGEPDTIYTTFCGQFCEFVITVRDHFGQQLLRGGNRVQAVITDCPLAQKEIWATAMKFLDVKDNDNGTYSLSYLPAFPGKYVLAVAVDSKNIKGSPFCWYVSQKIVNINKCSLDYSFSSDPRMYQGNSTTIDDIVIDGGYCFSWRVKFRSNINLYSSFIGDSSMMMRTCSHLGPQQSFFQGCKIGVKKCERSLTNSETSLASTCIESPSSRGSIYSNWRELTKDAWFWCDGYCYSPNEPTGTQSNITTFEDGDIFVLFLNPVKRTLIIYNRESKQGDCIENIKCPVRPFLKD